MPLIKTILLGLLTFWVTLLLYDTLFAPISTLMMARVLTLRPIERRFMPLNRISPNLIRAVIAAEDGRFCDHHGVDWKAMHAVVQDVVVQDDTSHGGSTISMQTTKNLFLWITYANYPRKALEIPLALLLDATWSKRRIMETYLNVAEFGPGIFGAEAASEHYFHHSAAVLTQHDASLLAAILPSPMHRNAAHPTMFVSRYADSIAARSRTVASSCTK